MRRSRADVVREYGPFPVEKVAGVTHDGSSVWFAAVDKLHAVDRESGKLGRSLDVAAQAGTAFDGQHVYQIADNRMQKIDPATGHVLATIPSPGGSDSGSRGPKGRSGWGSIASAGSIRSTRAPASSCARSNPTASSPA